MTLENTLHVMHQKIRTQATAAVRLERSDPNITVIVPSGSVTQIAVVEKRCAKCGADRSVVEATKELFGEVCVEDYVGDRRVRITASIYTCQCGNEACGRKTVMVVAQEPVFYLPKGTEDDGSQCERRLPVAEDQANDRRQD